VRRALERAYEVAWALRGPPAHRAQHRAALGWIAVSPEDDPPARPVNVPIGDHAQRDLWPAVAFGEGARRVARTRALVASTTPIAAIDVPADRVGVVPRPGAPIPSDGPVLLYAPGHSSLAEEAAPLMTALINEARRDGRALTIVAVDLPSAGYAERIDPEEILAAFDHADDALLRFHDAFLIGVVEALEAQDRIAAVIGGSLGGNLALRMGELDLPWVRRVVAWSPASIDFSWSRARVAGAGDDEFNDLVKHEAVRLTRDESEEAEARDSRRDYFVGGLTSVSEQADYWYRDDWACKDAMIHEGHLQLGEIYDARFRRWHYRLAYEQLVFSHLEVRDDGRRRFERITAPLLLLAGEEDDSMPMSTWSFAHRLAAHLTGPGRSVFLEDTGHAMHSERPRLVGAVIWAFLRDTELR
jgi:pimeloyl-ACP methyl ester carboxylesterase